MSSPIRGITTCGVPAAVVGLATASPRATVATRMPARAATRCFIEKDPPRSDLACAAPPAALTSLSGSHGRLRGRSLDRRIKTPHSRERGVLRATDPRASELRAHARLAREPVDLALEPVLDGALPAAAPAER